MQRFEQFLSSPEGILLLAGTLFLLLMTNACHEGAHALVAWWQGDRTQRILRRCTLNPLRHFSWFLTLILPLLALWLSNGLFMLAGAKPVMVDRHQVGRFGMARVALAGPIANFLFAGFLIVVLALAIDLEWFGMNYANWVGSWFWTLIYFPLWFAVVLGIVNLFPLPGLDGGHILASFLPERAREIWYRLTPLGFVLFILFFLWQGGFLARWGIGDPPSGPSLFQQVEGRLSAYVQSMVAFLGSVR